jgi:hypothetical protein
MDKNRCLERLINIKNSIGWTNIESILLGHYVVGTSSEGADALEVNWCEIITTSPDGKTLHKNAFATNFKISKNNVKEIVRDGRTRWEVEMESFQGVNSLQHPRLWIFSTGLPRSINRPILDWSIQLHSAEVHRSRKKNHPLHYI